MLRSIPLRTHDDDDDDAEDDDDDDDDDDGGDNDDDDGYDDEDDGDDGSRLAVCICSNGSNEKPSQRRIKLNFIHIAGASEEGETPRVGPDDSGASSKADQYG